MREEQKEVFDIIPITSIYTNSRQPRKLFREESMEDLISSLKEHGILVPLIVEKVKEGYKIISGERRYKAAKTLGIKKMPVIIKEVSPKESLEISIIENIQRENLTIWEEAYSYNQILKEYNITQEELSLSLGKSRSSISNIIRILSLPENIQEALHSSIISLGHAKLLLSLKEDPALQSKFFQEIIEKNLSVKDLEYKIKNQNKEVLKNKEKDPSLSRWKNKILHILGSHVNIKGTSQKGKLIISYSSEKEFNSICSFFEKRDK